MAEKKEEKATYTKSTEQLDLEERMADDYVSPKVIVQGEVPNQMQEGGFVNVDPIYQNYANEADKPGHAQEGVYAKLEDEMFGEDLAEKARKGKVTEKDIEDAKAKQAEAEATPAEDDKDEEETDDTKSSSTESNDDTKSSSSTTTATKATPSAQKSSSSTKSGDTK